MQLTEFLDLTGKTLTALADESGWFEGLTSAERTALQVRMWRHAHGKRRPGAEDIERYRVATKGAVTAEDWNALLLRRNEEAEPSRAAASG